MDNIIKDCLSALDRLENDALNSRDGYGYSGGDAETIRRAISENEALRRENEELKAKLEKAKDALNFYAYCQGVDGNIGHRARTTLEELGE